MAVAANTTAGTLPTPNWNSTFNWPTYSYPYYVARNDSEEARLRFALELVADAETLEEARRIVRKALKLKDQG